MKLKRVETKSIKIKNYAYSEPAGIPLLETWERSKKGVDTLYEGERAKLELMKILYDFIEDLRDNEVVLFNIEKAKIDEIYEL